MAKKGHSAASRRQAAARVAMNNVQRTTAVAREPRKERTQPEATETPAAIRTTPRITVEKTSRASVKPAIQSPDASIQYPYVIGDLKQLGIIAAAMFAVLIILSLIIR
jgi:hypothetical protein